MQHRHQRLPQEDGDVEVEEEARPDPTHRLLVPPAPSNGDDEDDELDGSTGANSQSGLTTFEVDAAVLGLSEEVPSAVRLTRARPYLTGYLLKKKDRFFGLCPCCFKPTWRTRYFIVSGQYLYRYASETAAAPKGKPIALECANFRTVQEDEEVMPYCFVVSTLSKELVLSAGSEGERQRWLDVLRDGKQRSIKETLGHVDPRKEHVAFNRLAGKIVNRYNRRALASSQLQSSGLEMRAYFSSL